MELEFNKEQEGNIYNLEMSEELFLCFKEEQALKEKENMEFENFLKEKGIKI